MPLLELTHTEIKALALRDWHRSVCSCVPEGHAKDEAQSERVIVEVYLMKRSEAL